MATFATGAYDFDCALEPDELINILNAAGPWTWTMRDSHWYGDYLIARANQGKTKLRIVEYRQTEHLMLPGQQRDPSEQRYVIWAEHAGESGDDRGLLDELDSTIQKHVLPAIGARGLRRVEAPF